VQARIRTFYLMNSGFVLGTGDMSELALGWCTYNGDHMSMYNVNSGVPKTLIKFMISYVAENHYEDGPLRKALLECAGLVVSPELLPCDDEGNIQQSTEDVLGPYELHDFYLFNFVRNGFSPEKMLYLSGCAELKKYSLEVRQNTLVIFLRRFFSQQFKRDCVPNGPKVGSVSLSPRGDWRMPSDASSKVWLDAVEDLIS
jgi:NAD+ synthase (glutamine-hydrolysing)